MPFPWKKTRVARISRLVADLHSPKHGNSLVVQTGFPTSLVDLFVKNRDRLNKKKKRSISTQVSPVEKTEKLHSNASPPSPPQSVAGLEGNGVVQDSDSRLVEVLVEPIVKRPSMPRIEEQMDGCNGKKRELAIVLKIFTVAVLAMSNKKFAVAITTSALSLLFMEYIWKKSSRCLNQFPNRVFAFPYFRFMKPEEVEDVKPLREEKECTIDANVPAENLELGSSGEEIQVVEEPENKEPELKLRDYLSMDRQVLELEKERSKKAKLKARIKKIVSKKLRSGKKGKKAKEQDPESSMSEVSSIIAEENAEKVDNEENCDKQALKFILPVQGKKEKDACTEEMEELDGQSFLTQNTTMEIENVVVDETSGIRRRKGNSGYFFFLMVSLSGLIGGRMIAVMLTVSWFLVVHLVVNSSMYCSRIKS